MRLLIYDHGALTGSVTVDGDGYAVPDAGARYLVDALRVIEPDTLTPLTPADGARYIRALAYEFRSGYGSARLVP